MAQAVPVVFCMHMQHVTCLTVSFYVTRLVFCATHFVDTQFVLCPAVSILSVNIPATLSVYKHMQNTMYGNTPNTPKSTVRVWTMSTTCLKIMSAQCKHGSVLECDRSSTKQEMILSLIVILVKAQKTSSPEV